MLPRLSQSPTEPGFVQDPYPFYARARAAGDLIQWAEYGLPVAVSHGAVSTILRDRRFGREPLEPLRVAPDLQPFYDIEAHSMLELEPPRHTKLRGEVLRSFTSRQVTGLAPQIQALAERLVAAFPSGPFDLLEAYARPIPVAMITRLLGVAEEHGPQLLRWSNAMVRMYQAGRTRDDEEGAVAATLAFRAFIEGEITALRAAPRPGLLSDLIGAEVLSEDEIVSTAILLLNAGHEATVHALGNAVARILGGERPRITASAVEEFMRIDPPLHLFNRIARQRVTLFDHTFEPGDEVACALASANRDPAIFAEPDRFVPERFDRANRAAQSATFGGGIHFCVGAPLARMEMIVALTVLLQRCPNLRLAEPPMRADVYHFHGLKALMVEV